MEPLRAAYERVLERIDAACRRVGRDPARVSVLPITKGVTPERVGTAAMIGMTVFGENRVQEAMPKIQATPAVQWSLVGHLQSNKAAPAVQLFDEIQSVDSLHLAETLGQLAHDKDARFPLSIYLQVNVDRDPRKHGFSPDEVDAAVSQLAGVPSLELRGLMTVGRMFDRPEDARPTFARLRELSDRLRARNPALGDGLSMGMSDDFEIAVEEGSTLVRIGRALFGERPRGWS